MVGEPVSKGEEEVMMTAAEVVVAGPSPGAEEALQPFSLT